MISRKVGLVLIMIALHVAISPIAVGAFRSQVLKNNLAAGKDGKGVTVLMHLRQLGGANPTPPVGTGIKDRNGGALLVMAPRAGNLTWDWAGNQAGLNVTADPADPGVNGSSADFYWSENNKVSLVTLTGGKWLDQNNMELGDIKILKNAVAVLEIPRRGLPSQGSVTFFNEESENIVFTNIKIYRNQPLQNYSMEGFLNHTGTPMDLPDIMVAGNSESSEIPIGSVDPDTYQLVIADCYKITEPQSLFRTAVGSNLDEVILLVPVLSQWAVPALILILLSAIAIKFGWRQAGNWKLTRN